MSLPIYLIVTSYFPTPSSWRCAFVLDQAKAIQRTGRYEVVVVNVNYDADYVYEGIKVYSMMGVHAGSFLCPALYDFINCRRFEEALSRANVRANQIAVVHSHLVTTACYAVHLKHINPKTLCLVQLHDADPLFTIMREPRWDVLQIKRWLYYRRHRWLLESADAVVAISSYVAKVAREFPRQTVLNRYLPMKRSMKALAHCRSPLLRRIIELHNGVDTRVFNHRDGCLNARNDGLKSLTIGCIGNFIDLKDQMSLLEAVKRVNSEEVSVVGKLLFVGSGTLLGKCKNYVSEHRLESVVEFHEEVEHSLLADFYRSLDLFVLPSYFEGFGCVFLEAHACGTPFITCEGQGIEDYIFPEDRSLWLCRQQDPADLASKILYYYKNRPAQRLRGETDIDKLVPAFLDEVEKIEGG